MPKIQSRFTGQHNGLQLFANLTGLDTLGISYNKFSGSISELKFLSSTLQIVRVCFKIMRACVRVRRHRWF